MQIKITRKSVAGTITVIISLFTLSVMYHGIRTGIGVIPGFSFLLWTLIALAYSIHEEITEYVKDNHTKVTEPLIANMQAMKTNIVETARRDSIEPFSRIWGNTRSKLKQSLLVLLHQLIQALENPDDSKPPHNP
ncbi:hypothetical protein KAW53_03535 [Candidatus Bathyarchaeota archaeon]|nr:hypothetical protein [Candidatus Bathyarchaeota archaeon]